MTFICGPCGAVICPEKCPRWPQCRPVQLDRMKAIVQQAERVLASMDNMIAAMQRLADALGGKSNG